MKPALAICLAATTALLIGSQIGRTQQAPEAMPWPGPNASEGGPGGRPGTPASGQWQAYVNGVAAVGQKLGYAVKVGRGEFGTIDATYVKEGKSDTRNGVLGKQWDQRETIQIRYLPTNSGLQPTFARRIVEEKPPIGDWKTVREGSEVPAAFLTLKPEAPK